MIKSFADKETEKVYNQIFSRKLPHPQIIWNHCMEIGKGNTAFVSMISIVSAFRSKERMTFKRSKSLIITDGARAYYDKQRGGA